MPGVAGHIGENRTCKGWGLQAEAHAGRTGGLDEWHLYVLALDAMGEASLALRGRALWCVALTSRRRLSARLCRPHCPRRPPTWSDGWPALIRASDSTIDDDGGGEI